MSRDTPKPWAYGKIKPWKTLIVAESGTQGNSGTPYIPVSSQEESNTAVEHIRSFGKYSAEASLIQLVNLTSYVAKRRRRTCIRKTRSHPQMEALVERDEPLGRRDEGHLANQELGRRSTGGSRWRTLTMRRQS